MPRKAGLKHLQKEIYTARQAWYIYHYENRQKFNALTPETQKAYIYVAGKTKMPTLTAYGGTQFDHLTPDNYRLSHEYGLDPHLINPFYVSDKGWDEFQRQWQNLPEPIQLYTEGCVQVGELYTVSTIGDVTYPNLSTIPQG